MSNWLSLPILTLAALLQATFMPQIRILGGMPDLIFLLVLAWSVNSPLETGVTWAFAGGILQDLMSASPTGASVIGLVLLVFGISQLSRQVYGISIAVYVGLVLFGTILQQLVLMLVLSLSGFHVQPVETFTLIVLPTAAYNLLFSAPIYWLVRRVQRRFVREGAVAA